jgi:MOSC domain-containing protein YiiM
MLITNSFVKNPMPHIVEILVSDSPSAPMVSRESVQAVPGRGLEGDRYFSGTGTFSPKPHKPDFEVTLIEQEQIDLFARNCGRNFSAKDARRNLVTEGVDLNALVGCEFSIGEVTIRGIRLCEPCDYLAGITFPEVLEGLARKGGLRAQIVTNGLIRVGDPVVRNAGG